MTISELKPGYLVQLNNGEFYMVMPADDGLYLVREKVNGTSQWLRLDNSRLDISNGLKEFTIIKIYGYNKYSHLVFDFSPYRRDLLWERKPKKKKYTYAQLKEILGEEFEVVG